MKVGIVTGSYTPRLGGAVTHTNLIAKALAEHKHSTEVFCPDLQKEGQFVENGLVVNRFRVPSFSSRPQVVAGLRKGIQRRRRDIDVFVSPEYNAGALAMALSSAPHTVGIYGADVSFEAPNLHRDEVIPYEKILQRRGLLYWFQVFLLKRLSCTIALNRFDEQRLRRHTPKVFRVGCWVDTPILARPLQSPPRVATIIGRSVCWKRIGRAYAVAREIQSLFPEMQIQYFGEKPMRKPGMTDFAGLPNHEVLKALQNSDVTINMSDYETYCITNLEVMACRSLLLVHPLPQYDYLTDSNCILSDWVRRARDAFATRSGTSILDAAQETVRKEHDNAGILIEQLERIAGVRG